MRLRFRLNHLYQGQNSPFLYAADAGLFAGIGVEIGFIEGFSSSQVTRAILAKEADLGFGDVTSAIESALRSGERRVRCLLPIFVRSPCALGYHRDEPPLTLAALDGKTLCGPDGDTSARLLPALLARNGLEHIRYSFRAVSPEERDRLVASRQVLAATCFDATLKFAMRMRGYDSSDIDFLYFADHGLDDYTAGVLYDAEVFAQQPGLADAVAGVVQQAWLACREDPARGVAAVMRRSPDLDASIVRDQLNWVLEHQVFPAGRPSLVFDFASERWRDTVAVARFGASGELAADDASLRIAWAICGRP